jgi:glycerol-3-phosphate dehydrogenase (NAD(P)+)
MKVTILGAGAWGTTLGLVLSQNEHEVTLWAHRPEHLRELERTRRNERYLPGVELPAGWNYLPDLEEVIHGASLIVMAVPSKAFRGVAGHLRQVRTPIVSVTKGIEFESGMTMTEVLHDAIPGAELAALSGPTFAIVGASRNAALAELVQQLFHRPSFRVYTSTDLAGVELGGALKNVIAVAAGLGDALGFGDSSKAALVTRALAEMRRLGVACGAQPETFAGLSGLGDLTLTCFSQLSRNRRFGERLARGESADRILASSHSVEGYPTARSSYRLARKLDIVTPIIDEVHALLYENKNIADSLRALTTRSSKPED